MDSSAALSTFTLLSNHYHHPSPECLHFCQTGTLTIKTLNYHSPLPQPLTTTVLLPVSMNLTILETSYKWSHNNICLFVTDFFQLVQCLQGSYCIMCQDFF